jgi:hypothetical protein
VKGLLLVLSIVVLWPLSASWAQLETPNEAGVAPGHFHAVDSDAEAKKKFWTTVEGTPSKSMELPSGHFPGSSSFSRRDLPPAALTDRW